MNIVILLLICSATSRLIFVAADSLVTTLPIAIAVLVDRSTAFTPIPVVNIPSDPWTNPKPALPASIFHLSPSGTVAGSICAHSSRIESTDS